MDDLEVAIETFHAFAKDASGRFFTDQELPYEDFYFTARDAESRTLLHVACEYQYDSGVLDLVEEALSNGADPNAVDKHGNTPLHVICSTTYGDTGYEQCEVIDELLRAGARIDCQGPRGCTPLLLAMHYIRSDDPSAGIDGVVKLLISRGAGVNIADSDGVTPLHVAVVHDDVATARALLKRGASRWLATTGNEGLYDRKLILVDNHSGVEVPIGSRPGDLAHSEKMRRVFAAQK